MAVVDFTDWMSDFTRPDVVWYVKRLAANDTLASKAHQAGPYIARDFLFKVFPSLDQPAPADNLDAWFDLYVDSHADHRRVRVVWYNNRLRGGTRNETRLTNFGGQASALLDPDSTGALTIFAFVKVPGADAAECHVWVCRTEVEEELAEDRVGPVEPGRYLVWTPAHGIAPATALPAARLSCRLEAAEIPPAWLTAFPSGAEIIRKAIELRADTGLDPDERLLRRRDCEFEIFLSVEEAVEMPAIRAGFDSIEAFVARAQTILQRRKARSGRSLELHTHAIFVEEGLAENVQFAHGVDSEPGRRPDFLFPSQDLYRDPAFPAARLRMLAVKTTVRDRWRQILNEAGRIPVKHLLTLQEGVSAGQFQEMKESGVRLVVPAGLVKSYPEEIRPDLITLESFIGDVRLLGM
jgi:hypothetical protein